MFHKMSPNLLSLEVVQKDIQCNMTCYRISQCAMVINLNYMVGVKILYTFCLLSVKSKC